MSFCDILISGAGPVGLTAAIEAQRRGFKVLIIDKQADSTSKSNALVINSRTLEILEASGVTDKILQEGYNVKTAKIMNKNLKIILKLQMKNIPSRFKTFVVLPQNKTENLLNRHLQETYGIQAQRQNELVDFEDLSKPFEMEHEKYNIRSVIQDPTGKQEVVYSKYLIGADGVHSNIRKTLGIKFDGFQVNQKFSFLDGKINMPEELKDRLIAILNPKPGYSVLFFVCIGNGIYRMGSFTNTVEELFDLLPKGVTIERVDWSTIFQSQVRQVESYQKGHVFLAGDAAHCHSPVGGRGMNLGIEDACVLIGLMKQNKTGLYTSLRHPTGKKVLQVTTAMQKFLGKKTYLVTILRTIMFKAMSWFPFLQKYLLKRLQGLNSSKFNDILQ